MRSDPAETGTSRSVTDPLSLLPRQCSVERSARRRSWPHPRHRIICAAGWIGDWKARFSRSGQPARAVQIHGNAEIGFRGGY
jgi:hypothetical protein